MIGQTDVIHDVSTSLSFGDSVYSGDGLQEVVIFHLLVDVHDLFNRCIEAGEQHVAHDQERHACVDLLRVVVVEFAFEILHSVN